MLLRKSGTVVSIVLFLVCCGQQVSLAKGRILEIYQGTDVFGLAAQSLVAGDNFLVNQGILNETLRKSIREIGQQNAPIMIKGANGESRPLITRPSSAPEQNTINIEGEATWLTLRGIEIAGNVETELVVGALAHHPLEDGHSRHRCGYQLANEYEQHHGPP
jgi:hypothetical protein